MKIMNWEAVEEFTPIDRPVVGGYVARIVDVEDVVGREYLNIIYDIAEGDYSGFYSDDFGKNNPWSHKFVRSYKENCTGMFKAFLTRLEEGNKDFDVAAWQKTCDEKALIGLEIGIVLQYEDYTNERGEDKERLQVVGVYATQDIRNGDYKLPARKDSRKKAAVPIDDGGIGQSEQVPVSAYNDLPF